MKQSGGWVGNDSGRSSIYEGPGAGVRNKEASEARVWGSGKRVGEMKGVVGSQ